MKESQVKAMMLNGAVFAIGTFIGEKTKEVRRKAPEKGQAATFHTNSKTVMLGGRPAVISSFADDDEKPTAQSYQPKAGDKVVIAVREFKEIQYGDFIAIRGEMMPYEAGQ